MLIIGSLFQANFTRMTGYLFKKTMYTHCGQLLGSRCTQCYPIVLVRRTYFSGKNASLDDQSRIYLQSLGVDLGKVNKTFRNRIIWSLDVIEPKIRILLKAGIEKSSICQMIIYRPRILNMNEDILKIRLVFLKSLGLTESKLSKLLSEHSFLLTYQESDAQNLLSFLQSRDFNKFKAWDIIIKRPRLILVGAQNLRHTVKLLKDNGLSPLDINNIITHHTSILLLPIPQLKKVIDVISLYQSDKASIQDIISNHPSILLLTYVAIANIANWLNHWLRLSNAEIGFIMLRYPKAFAMTTKSLAKTVGYYQSLGIDIDFIRRIWVSNPAYLQHGHEVLSNQLHSLIQLKFTEKQSRMMFDLNPSILGHSQNSLQRKCDYLIKKMGYSHQIIAENAAILSCSLDTIMYRCSSLSKHSIDKELVPIAQLLLSTDDAFQEDILNGRNYIEIESKDTMELQSEGSKEQHCS
ncbi:hypothetical protein TrispH2_009532 [Trichoplax sp. H2]|nr:hypothetical protein TrispH2_009532 [Trichoplax sp. H2]|eukprot:RDD38920.1 hypothetical protein TrispH2_009532 [Trichoplax sp. H2]